jgi:hypothetical protein
VVIARRRFAFWRAEDRFDGQSVFRVRLRDSTMNGGLLGMAGGAAIAAAMSFSWGSELSGESRLEETATWLYWCPWFAIGGAVIGQAVDGRVNKTIYERPPATPVVQMVPFAARQSAGLVFLFRF